MLAVVTGMLLLSVLGQASELAGSTEQRWQTLDNPATAGSLAPRFAQAADGTLYLSWLQKQSAEDQQAVVHAAGRAQHALKYARLQAASGELGFQSARSIASGTSWFANWADTPALYIHSDTFWLAHWLQKSAASTYAYDIMLSSSSDGGDSWSPPFSPHSDNTSTEHGFISHFPATDERLGLIWLDGRETQAGSSQHAHGGAMTLRMATLDAVGSISNEQLLDERVCDCCQTAAVTIHGGSEQQSTVLAYRDRSAGDIRDIAVMRLSEQGWSKPQIVHADGWHTRACPVNGPALAASGDLVALTWFTMADATPRVQLAVSADAGKSFTLRQTFSSGSALGRVQLLAHEDGWLLSWLDQPRNSGLAVIRLASLNADGEIRWQQQLTGVSSQRASGIPRIAALADGRIVMAWTGARADQSIIHTSIFQPDSE